MDAACVISASLFFASAVLTAMETNRWANARDDIHRRGWFAFDPAIIKEDWDWRNENRPLGTAAGFVNGMAWLVLAVPVVQAAWLSSRTSGNSMIALHISVVVLAIAGAFSEIISRALTLGGLGTMGWMSEGFRMFSWMGEDSNDQLGWQTLELLHTVVSRLVLWIDALEFLFLSGIFLFFFVATWSQTKPVLSLRWASLGLLLSIVSILDFTASILRFDDWRMFTTIAGYISGLTQMFLFPVWLLWLGRLLPKAELELLQMEGRGQCARPGGEIGLTSLERTTRM